ncbi:MAG TPA: DUF1365 family protein [Caulobacteraceae bacterium]
MKPLASGLYGGSIIHQRFSPRRHRLRYSLFQILFDLDEMTELDTHLALFSHNRFNLFSFHDRDHGGGEPGPLRAWVERALASAGIETAGGAIRVLCLPRLLGYVFNPLTVYFCHHADGRLTAMLYEVNNTFGQRHSYLIAVEGGDPRSVRQSCAKAFHVSPFLGMEMTYDFQIAPPGDSIATTVLGRDGDGHPVIRATFAGRRRALTDRVLLAALVRYPLMTLKVVAAIHWEALKLVLKGVRLQRRPRPPAREITVVS